MTNEQLSALELIPCPKGFTQIYSVNPLTGAISGYVAQKNTIMSGAADILPRVVAGDQKYKIMHMFMQFENLSDPGDSPVVPSYETTHGIEYFLNLDVHASQDILRVPVMITPSFTATSEDYEGNLVTFVAISGGFEAGEFGKPFSDANNSAVFGGALVASPTGSVDGDIVFARNYPTGAKVLKPAGEQIVMQWSIEFSAS